MRTNHKWFVAVAVALVLGSAQAQEAGPTPTVSDALKALHDHASVLDSYHVTKTTDPIALKDKNAWDIIILLVSEAGSDDYDKVVAVDVIFQQGALLSIDATDFPTGNISQPRFTHVFGHSTDIGDATFFSGAHLGITIQAARAYYQKLGRVAVFWHSDAPAGELQIDFRTATSPQRRVYVYYSKTDNKIVSVSYWKLGEGETFSEAERNYLVNLNGRREDLIAKILDAGSAFGSQFEVTTPQQYEIESQEQ